MSAAVRSAILSLGLVAAVGLISPGALAGEGVNLLVLREHGVGSAAQAQPYVDKLVAVAAKQNGWPSASGRYVTTRGAAESYVESDKPHYGILSLGAFLGLRAKHSLEVLGQVSVARAGGQQYHLISKVAGDLAGCKGKRLASDHVDDVAFVEKVVSGGAFKLSDFTLVATSRPLQTIKKVVASEAECALIDDAQLEELGHLDGAADVKSVWKSEKLPPMVLVAWPVAPAAERAAFQSNLAKICEGDGKQICGEIGLSSLKAATAADYASVVAAYSK